MKNCILIILLGIGFIHCTLNKAIAVEEENLYLTIEEVAIMEGEYTGTLEYLDYSDDQTKTSLKMTANFTIDGKKIKVINRFNEGNGRVETRKGYYKIKGGKIDGHPLLEKVISGDGIRLVWLETGKDGNDQKSATFRFTMEGDGTNLSIRKEVKYDGEADFFTRNLTQLRKK